MMIDIQFRDISSTNLKERLEWLTYKESRRNFSKDSDGMLQIESLSSSFIQGAGVGFILSPEEVIKEFASFDGKSYTRLFS